MGDVRRYAVSSVTATPALLSFGPGPKTPVAVRQAVTTQRTRGAGADATVATGTYPALIPPRP
jgi:hypothetical protein